MTRIGLISDTHGHLDPQVFEHFKECDEIWHAGDIGNKKVYNEIAAFKPLRAVYGNIDGQELRAICPEDNWFMCEDLQVWITHIGGYPPRYNKRVKEVLKNKVPDLFICGHSHILKIIKDPKLDLLHINPGAAGIQGFHRTKTLVRFSVEGKSLKNMQVIELGKRGQK